MTAPITYILAGNKNEAHAYASAQRWQLKDWRPVGTIDTTHGIRRKKILTVGTWDKRPDVVDLIAILREQGCTFIHSAEER